MRKIRKGYNLAFIFTLILVFLCQNLAYARDISYLRVPVDGHKRVEEALRAETNLANLTTDQLIIEAELAMPRWDDENPDWTKFKRIVAELRNRKDADVAEVLVIAGLEFENEGVDIEYDCNISEIEESLSTRIPPLSWLLPTVYNENEYGYAIYKDEEGFFISILHNVYQHVRTGVALVVKQRKITRQGNKYSEISVIDNGAGPIYEDGRRASIKDILEYEKNVGKNSGRGMDLSFAARGFANFSVIDVPGETAIVMGREMSKRLKSRGPRVIRPSPYKTSKTYGMTVTGYFLREGANPEDVKKDIIRRTEERLGVFTSPWQRFVPARLRNFL